jgi:hypothetical protein
VDRPLREKVVGMVKMLANPRMMLLLPMMFFTGLNNTFYAAWFTRQILSCHTGMVLLALGAGEMAGAYLAGARVLSSAHVLPQPLMQLPGKVADTFKKGQQIVLFSASAMQAAALCGTLPPSLRFCNILCRYLSVVANGSGDYTKFYLPAGATPSHWLTFPQTTLHSPKPLYIHSNLLTIPPTSTVLTLGRLCSATRPCRRVLSAAGAVCYHIARDT